MYNFQIKGKIKIMGLFTGNFYSKNLRMTTQINVIFPDVSNDVTPLYEGTPKVLYLLHGLSGNSDEWTRFSKIARQPYLFPECWGCFLFPVYYLPDRILRH